MQSVLAGLFKFGLNTRRSLYDSNMLRSVDLPVPTVSVGNISLGGTGKSAYVALLAKWFVEAGRSPVVLSRGYGRSHREPVILTAGEGAADAAFIGDEPCMIKHKVPATALVVDARRGRVALQNWQRIQTSAVALLDDAFQHWQVRRDMDIVLIDVTEDSSGRVLPEGKFREPLAALARADVIIFTRANEASDEICLHVQKHIAEAVEAHASKSSVSWQRNQAVGEGRPKMFFSQYVITSAHTASGELFAPEELGGENFVLLSGIARPDSFRKLVEKAGIRPVEQIILNDHQNFDDETVSRLNGLRKKYRNLRILTTEKDFYRWRNQTDTSDFVVLQVEPELFVFDAGKRRICTGEFRDFMMNWQAGLSQKVLAQSNGKAGQ